MKFLKDMLTADAKSSVYDPVRFGTLASLLVGLGLVVYSVVWRGATFDLVAFGTGVGLIIAAGGGAMAVRKDRESNE